MFYLPRSVGPLLVAEHAKAAGELMGDGDGFSSQRFGEGTRGGLGGGMVEKIEAFLQQGELALPETGETGFDFSLGPMGVLTCALMRA